VGKHGRHTAALPSTVRAPAAAAATVPAAATATVATTTATTVAAATPAQAHHKPLHSASAATAHNAYPCNTHMHKHIRHARKQLRFPPVTTVAPATITVPVPEAVTAPSVATAPAATIVAAAAVGAPAATPTRGRLLALIASNLAPHAVTRNLLAVGGLHSVRRVTRILVVLEGTGRSWEQTSQGTLPNAGTTHTMAHCRLRRARKSHHYHHNSAHVSWGYTTVPNLDHNASTHIQRAGRWHEEGGGARTTNANPGGLRAIQMDAMRPKPRNTSCSSAS
jgi:hypothetical protein